MNDLGMKTVTERFPKLSLSDEWTILTVATFLSEYTLYQEYIFDTVKFLNVEELFSSILNLYLPQKLCKGKSSKKRRKMRLKSGKFIGDSNNGSKQREHGCMS